MHHFWAWFAVGEWSKSTQVQRSDNRYNNAGGVFECDCFPPSHFMFAIQTQTGIKYIVLWDTVKLQLRKTNRNKGMQVESEERGKKKKGGTEQGVSTELCMADTVTELRMQDCRKGLVPKDRGKGSPTSQNMSPLYLHSVCNNLTFMRLHVHLTNF